MVIAGCKGLPIALALLVVPSIVLVACGGGVSQDEFAERAAPEEENATLQAPQAALEEENATLQARQTALEEDYADLQAQHATLAEDNADLQARQAPVAAESTAVRDGEAEIRDLRNAADIKFALASGAVQRFRGSDWDSSFSPGLAATAMKRLDEFIDDANDLTAKTRSLGSQGPAEAVAGYETGARLYDARIQEALYLGRLVQGLSAQNAAETEISDTHFSCKVVTDQMKASWASKLDEAIAHHRAGIDKLSKAEEISPEVSIKFSEALAELERLIGEAASLKGDFAPIADASSRDDDHGNSISEATPGELPCEIAGTIGYFGDLDYFSFRGEADTTYFVEAAGDFLVIMHNAQGQQLASGQGSFAYAVTASETAYVSVQNRSRGTGSYTLSISVPSDDHGNSASNATAVMVPSTGDGAIEYVGDADYFSFEAEAGTAYVITIPGDFVVTLQNSQNQHVSSGQGEFAYIAQTSAVLYALVQDRSRGTGSYTLSITTPSDDHGNSTSNATAVQISSTRDGTIEYAGDMDYFSFEAEAGTAYVFTIPGDFTVTLQNLQNQHLGSGQGEFAYTAQASAVLYALVQNRTRRTGPYTFSVSAPDDDHGNSISTATAVEAPSDGDGTIEYVGDLDYYSFEAEAGTTYAIASPSDFAIDLYDSEGRRLFSGQVAAAPAAPAPAGSSISNVSPPMTTIAHTASASGALYVLVQNRSRRTGTYSLSISAPTDDHGNSISNATAVEVPSTTEGVVEYGGDLDYFSFQAEAGTAYAVATGGDFLVTLYNSQGNRLISEQLGGGYTATVSEILFVSVRNRFGSTGSYAVGVFSIPVGS